MHDHLDTDAAALLARERYTFEDLRSIMVLLRSEGGCPWDREQTHESIRNNFIEETYEVVEAIDRVDAALLREELGDVLLQVIFHARIEEEAGRFGIDEVIHDICAKLIRRHPHIFAQVEVSGTADVLANWEAIKADEKSRVTLGDKLRSIPPMLPALLRAEKVGKKLDAAAADADAAQAALAEAFTALCQADDSAREAAYGELLFSAVTLGRRLGLSAETALTRATDRRIDAQCAREKQDDTSHDC